MGLMSKAKTSGIVEDAVAAWDEEQPVFVPLLVSGKIAGAGPMTDWARTIAEIEAVGWQLEQWSVTSSSVMGANFVQALPVFRRIGD